MQHILITGSNRGVGLALVKEYLNRGNVHIFAACRNPNSATDLQSLQKQNSGSVTLVKLDINKAEEIKNAVGQVSAHISKLDLLINNAGIYPRTPENTSLGHLDYDELSHVITTNSVSPVMVTQAFADLLKNGDNARVVMISSQMGSITRAGSGGMSYRMSKASLNMAAKVLSSMLHHDGVTVITTHPGHVSTDMGGASAPVSPAQSARGLADVIDSLTLSQSGKFFNYTGEEMPW